MLDEKNIGNDSSSLFNGNHFPSICIYVCRYVSYVKLTAQAELHCPHACSKSFLGGKD